MFRMLTAALLLVLLASPLAAQTDRPTDPRPNFSGTWVMDSRRSDSAQAPIENRVTSATLVIAHTDKEMLLDSTRNGVRESARYPMAGARHEPTQAVGTSGSIGNVQWDGPAMLTITPHEVNGMAVTTTERRTLSPDGKEMTVITQLQVQHGYQGPNAVNYSTPIKDVYVLQAQ